MGNTQSISSSDAEKALPSDSIQNTPVPPSSDLNVPSTPTTSSSSKNSRSCLLGPREHMTSTWSSIAALFARAPQENREHREPRVRSVHGGPRGYPELATFLDSDDNFMLYRRFGFLQSRILLEKQECLRLYEEELDELDHNQTSTPGDQNALNTLDLESSKRIERSELMAKIVHAWTEYAGLLKLSQDLVAMNKPSSSEYTSVENFMHNDKPLAADEGSFIYRKEDLIALRPGREHAWLDSSIEKVLRTLNCPVIEWVFCSKETKKKTNVPEEVYYTRARIETAVVIIITFMILSLLIVPIYLLFRLTDGKQTPRSNALCICVLLLFTLTFSAGVSLCSRARRHEILAASAAYCAVLVVFLGNVGVGSNVASARHGM